MGKSCSKGAPWTWYLSWWSIVVEVEKLVGVWCLGVDSTNFEQMREGVGCVAGIVQLGMAS